MTLPHGAAGWSVVCDCSTHLLFWMIVGPFLQIVGIVKIRIRTDYLVIWVEHEISFITSGPVLWHLGLVARKPVFGGLRTTQAQTSLHIRAYWSAPLLFTYWKVSYLTLLQAKFNILAILCSWGDWFDSRFVEYPEDRFSRDEAQFYKSKVGCKVQ